MVRNVQRGTIHMKAFAFGISTRQEAIIQDRLQGMWVTTFDKRYFTRFIMTYTSTCSDPFGYIQMHLDALRCGWMRSDAFRH